MKKSYKVLLIIISVLLLFGLVTGYKYLYYNTDTNNNNVYIYGDWDNDISILKNEDIIIQVPIYDFNQEIDDNTSISIQNFDDGEIYNIELNNKQEFDEFTSYTLQFNMLFNRTGYFELDNIEAVINTSSNTYSTNLGNYSVMVYDENSISNDIEIVGGSALVETISDENTYLLSYTLKNNSNNNILIEKINLNSSDKLSIDFDSVILSPNEEKDIDFTLSLDKSVSNAIIKPSIIGKSNDKTINTLGTSILVVDPVSIEKLYELINTASFLHVLTNIHKQTSTAAISDTGKVIQIPVRPIVL